MALYVPASRRRRRSLAMAGLALLVGLSLGVVAGRSSAPSVADRIADVRADARQAAARLRVVALHDETGAVSTQGGGDAGTDLVLRRTDKDLRQVFARAPWLTAPQRDRLLRQLTALATMPDNADPAGFAAAAESLATAIERTLARGERRPEPEYRQRLAVSRP